MTVTGAGRGLVNAGSPYPVQNRTYMSGPRRSASFSWKGRHRTVVSASAVSLVSCRRRVAIVARVDQHHVSIATNAASTHGACQRARAFSRAFVPTAAVSARRCRRDLACHAAEAEDTTNVPDTIAGDDGTKHRAIRRFRGALT